MINIRDKGEFDSCKVKEFECKAAFSDAKLTCKY